MGSPFKMNPKTPLMKALVGKQGNLPQHLKQAILDAPAKKTTDPKKKKDNFRYESDAPEVIGTAYTKDRTERVPEYKKGGKTMKKGDTYDRGGFQTPKKVVDTGRDASGRKKSGRTGTVDVEVKKGDIRFSTGNKSKGKKSPAKSYGKSPAKKTTDPKKKIYAPGQKAREERIAKIRAKSEADYLKRGGKTSGNQAMNPKKHADKIGGTGPGSLKNIGKKKSPAKMYGKKKK